MNEPYRPANGSEGYWFMDAYCEQCKKNQYDENTGEGGCDIQLRTMIHDIGEPGYPTEWVRGADGPTCTAFEEAT